MEYPSDSYPEEKADSERLDREYGFAIDKAEARVRETQTGGQTWEHLSVQVFQTPYAELARIVEETDPKMELHSWVDLGCAYARLGIVLARLRPETKFIGIEIAGPRVEEARRVYRTLGLDPGSVRLGNVVEEPLPDGEVYFIYDFGHRDEIERTIEKIQTRARRHPVRVVGRGRAVRDAIERNHPWLSTIVPPLHRDHYSIYVSSE